MTTKDAIIQYCVLFGLIGLVLAIPWALGWGARQRRAARRYEQGCCWSRDDFVAASRPHQRIDPFALDVVREAIAAYLYVTPERIGPHEDLSTEHGLGQLLSYEDDFLDVLYEIDRRMTKAGIPGLFMSADVAKEIDENTTVLTLVDMVSRHIHFCRAVDWARRAGRAD